MTLRGSSRLLLVAALLACCGGLSLAQDGGAEPTTPIRFDGKPFFPIGLYAYPKEHAPGTNIFESLAEEGFNFYLMPPGTKKEQLDQAHAAGIRVMITVRGNLELSGTPEAIEKKKKTLADTIGPGSAAFEHPAVVALEGPDEAPWNVKYRAQRQQYHPEVMTWARTPEMRKQMYDLLDGLRAGYKEVRRLCGDRYQIWINFAPRGDERELQWLTDLPPKGGYRHDGSRAADVFGTDIYPVPDGRGNNGWVGGSFVPSPAAVGLFTRKLRRAVHPSPFYMVLHGCAILEWDKKAYAEGRDERRPTFEEQQFMAFDAVVNGARGIVYWGANYISDNSMYWRHIGRVNRQLRALSPVLAEAEDWNECLPGTQQMNVLGKIYKDERYVIVTCNDPSNTRPGFVYVPGWKGNVAYSLLDGREIPVVDDVIRETDMARLSVRVYTDGTSLFKAFHRAPRSSYDKPPMRTLFALPLNEEPFKDKPPAQIAELLKQDGVDGIIKMPHKRPDLVDALRAKGIKAYAEIGCFSGKKHWETFPGTRPVTSEGKPFEGDYGGLCVNQDDYLADLFGRIEHLLDEAQYDGLWLDFIRWPGRWEVEKPPLTEVCFCETCVARFREDCGIACPAELADAGAKADWILKNHRAAWTAWKCDRVADVVARIRRIMKKKLGPDSILGIFAVPMRQGDFDGAVKRIYGQDWRKLGPHVDAFSPMVYHLMCRRPIEWISQVNAEVAAHSDSAVWPIVQSCSIPSELTDEGFEQCLREGLKAPSRGVMVFTTGHTLKEKKWEVQKKVFLEAAAGKK